MNGFGDFQRLLSSEIKLLVIGTDGIDIKHAITNTHQVTIFLTQPFSLSINPYHDCTQLTKAQQVRSNQESRSCKIKQISGKPHGLLTGS